MGSKATYDLDLVTLVPVPVPLSVAVLLVRRNLEDDQVGESLALIVGFKLVQHLIDRVVVSVELSQLDVTVVDPRRLYLLFDDVVVGQVEVQHHPLSVVREDV